jgi:hypothetical protein
VHLNVELRINDEAVSTDLALVVGDRTLEVGVRGED